jgi:hypothetical protein
MGLPDSHGVSRAPCYLGTFPRRTATLSPTGLSPSSVPFSNGVRLECSFVTSRGLRNALQKRPTTPCVQRLQPITYTWFGLFRFRSPLLTESQIAFLSSGYGDVSIRRVGLPDLFYSTRNRQGLPWRGFPIRESTDAFVSNNPWLIAGNYALRRLLVPRHPPHALSSLAKKPFPL